MPMSELFSLPSLSTAGATGDERMFSCLRRLAAGSALQLEALQPLLLEAAGREGWERLYHRQAMLLHLANLYEAMKEGYYGKF